MISKAKIICICLALALFFFNIYYFFINKNVSPVYYIKKVLYAPSDDILSLNIYIDLVEEYCDLNNKIKDKKVYVFLGDSITKRFNVYEYFRDCPVVNRGIFSDTTFGVIKRLEKNVNNLHVRKLFLMIGINDLRFRSDSEIANNIFYIATSVEAEEKYVQSILPVECSKTYLNNRILKINQKTRNLINSNSIKNIHFIDLHKRFLGKNGICIASKYTRDGIHPNHEGYKIWSERIKPLLQ